MRLRKDGIDSIARVKAGRDIFAAPPGSWTRSRIEELSAPRTACTAVQPSLPIVAISMMAGRINRHGRDHTTVGEVYLIERTIRIHQDLFAFAAYLFKLRHKLLEIGGWQSQ